MPSSLTLATLSDLRRLESAWLAAPSAQTRTAYLSAAMVRLPALLAAAEALAAIYALDVVALGLPTYAVRVAKIRDLYT